MKAIVGLGNPGTEYAGTRHNVGFDVVDELARRWGARLKKWKASADLAVVKEREVLLVEPKTFMNDSGLAVSAVMAFYKIQPSDVLVIVDEVQLPLGKLRLRRSGSAGGHNGLKSIIQELGTDVFPRLRIGVGRQPGELRNHVLGRFEAEEQDRIDAAVTRAAYAAELFAREGILAAMNAFNGPEPDATLSPER